MEAEKAEGHGRLPRPLPGARHERKPRRNPGAAEGMGVREREEAPDTFGIFVSFKVQSVGWEVLSSHPKSLYNVLERKKC